MAECLYRYSSNGVYYARIKAHGKEIRRSLGTTDRPLAQRRLRALKDEEAQVDRSRGRMTWQSVCLALFVMGSILKLESRPKRAEVCVCPVVLGNEAPGEEM